MESGSTVPVISALLRSAGHPERRPTVGLRGEVGMAFEVWSGMRSTISPVIPHTATNADGGIGCSEPWERRQG